jgi:hypothetical protein
MSSENEDLEVKIAEFASKLGETDAGPKHQIRLIVNLAGLEFSERILAETLEIEENGGLLTSDGTRRRTPGGVFFYVARGKLEPSIRAVIFPNYPQMNPIETMAWEERLPLVEAARDSSEYGEIRSAPRITINGLPKSVQIQDNTVVMIFEHTQEKLTYPRGIPTPPAVPTYFTVFMGKANWERVDKLLKKSAMDSLIIEGTCVFDQETGTIAVLAMIVNTKMAEKRLRKEALAPGLTGEDDETNIILPARPAIIPNPKKQDNPNAPKKKPIVVDKPMDNAKPTGNPKSEQSTDAKPAPQNKPKAPQENKPKAPQANQQKPKAPAENRFEPKATPPVATPAPVAVSTSKLSPESQAKLQQLEQAAITLRDRIATMEAKNQPGIAMTRKLLEKTERDIESLKRGS